MNKLEKIGTIEAAMLILIVMINKIISNYPKVLIENIGQSAWINVVFTSVIIIVFVYLILKIYQPFEGDILNISKVFRKMV